MKYELRVGCVTTVVVYTLKNCFGLNLCSVPSKIRTRPNGRGRLGHRPTTPKRALNYRNQRTAKKLDLKNPLTR